MRVLGCLPSLHSNKNKVEQVQSISDSSGRDAGHQRAPYRSPISLSPQQVLYGCNFSFFFFVYCLLVYCQSLNVRLSLQVDETVEWLSDYFQRSRLSKNDLRSFGLYSAWVPYIGDVVSFWEHLIGCLINVQISNCARESVGSSKVLNGIY